MTTKTKIGLAALPLTLAIIAAAALMSKSNTDSTTARLFPLHPRSGPVLGPAEPFLRYENAQAAVYGAKLTVAFELIRLPLHEGGLEYVPVKDMAAEYAPAVLRCCATVLDGPAVLADGEFTLRSPEGRRHHSVRLELKSRPTPDPVLEFGLACGPVEPSSIPPPG